MPWVCCTKFIRIYMQCGVKVIDARVSHWHQARRRSQWCLDFEGFNLIVQKSNRVQCSLEYMQSGVKVMDARVSHWHQARGPRDAHSGVLILTMKRISIVSIYVQMDNYYKKDKDDDKLSMKMLMLIRRRMKKMTEKRMMICTRVKALDVWH